jgi:ribosomal protein S18 acetylase RimI-like enzyme
MNDQTVRIVEYKPNLAAALADMWNRSGDSWGGYNIEFTAESVRDSEAASVYENHYLAMIGDEIVGCCKIGRWTEGEGALYVEVLNVRPDLHGRKIGKALMLRAVERTIELDWPRLDLHTWAGNTKAVPLYKKTGFFWEERDREVYLVNFIPAALKTELVSDFFKTADWYADSTRELLIEPDGVKENEFTYFRYSWAKDGAVLEMDYARRGRGLRRIHTDEFTITATVERPKTVFGRNYEVVYRIENRTGSAAVVSVRGSDDGPIRFQFDESKSVQEVEEICGSFFVDKIEKKQSEWKTHPRVTADVSFNGKSARFEIGIEPQFPVEVRLERSPGILSVGRLPEMFLNLESHLDVAADITVHMPVFDGLEFCEASVRVQTPALGRSSVRLPVTKAGAGIFSGEAKIATEVGGDRIEYPYEVAVELSSLTGVYHGAIRMDETATEYRVAAGSYSIGLAFERDSFRNPVHVRDAITFGYVGEFGTPKIGEPYSEEFIHREPDDIACDVAGDEAVLKATFVSTTTPGIILVLNCRVTAGGIVERWFTVRADERFTSKKPVKILDPFWARAPRPVVPYDGSIYEVGVGHESGASSWEGSRFSENWMYFRHKSGGVGLYWDAACTLRCDEWSFAFEHEFTDLAPGRSVDTSPISIVIGRFADWRAFRYHVTGIRSDTAIAREVVDVSVNSGNPFFREISGATDASKTVNVEIREHRLRDFDGDVSVEVDHESHALLKPDDEDRRLISGTLDIPETAGMQQAADGSGQTVEVDLKMDFAVLRYNRERTLFCVGDGEVALDRRSEDGRELLSARNDIISIELCLEYSHVIHSCRFDNVEWFANLYPEAGPRDWWNPWIGGFGSRPGSLSNRAVLKEPRNARLVNATDNFGNRWRGIESVVRFEEHERYLGLTMYQYFLLLPGVRTIMHHVRYEQNTGRYWPRIATVHELFAAGRDDSAECDIHIADQYGATARIRSGREERGNWSHSPITVRRPDRGESLTLYTHTTASSLHFETNKKSTLVGAMEGRSMEDGAVEYFAPAYLIFGDTQPNSESLVDLTGVTLTEITDA